jgi:hypothetical protein
MLIDRFDQMTRATKPATLEFYKAAGFEQSKTGSEATSAAARRNN